MKNLILICFFYIVNLTVSYAQEWNSTIFHVDLPGDFNLYNYKRILIAEILDKNGRVSNYSENIFDELTNSFKDMYGIEVVDREKVNLLLKEFNYQASGYVDEKFFNEKGKFKSSGLILVGRIQDLTYDENIETTNKLVIVNGCGTMNRRIGKYTLAFNFKLLNLENSEVVFSKTITAEKSGRTTLYDCATPPQLDKNKMYNECLQTFGEEISKTFTPHTKDFKVTFQKHRFFNDDLKKAIVYFNIKDFDLAFKGLEDIISKQTNTEALSSAYFNLAIAQYYSRNITDAKINTKKAYIINSKNSDALKLFNFME